MMKALAVFFLSVLFLLARASDNQTDCTTDPHGIFKGFYAPIPEWNLSWVIDCVASTWTVHIEVQNSGWVGLGLGTQQLMYPSDLYMAYFPNGTTDPIVLDKWATQRGPPPDDTTRGGVYNILLPSVTGVQTQGITTVTFSRYLHTGDLDYDLDIIHGDMIVLYAFHATSNSITTRHTTRGIGTVNFFTGKSSSPMPHIRKTVAFHGSTMLFVWGFFAVQGVYLPAFLRGLGPLWFKLHAGIHLAVLVLTLSAFVVIEIDLGQGEHFTTLHGIFGICVVAAVIIQVLLGYISHIMYNPARQKAPWFPDRVHWILGYILQLFAFATIYLGLSYVGLINFLTIVTGALWIGIVFLTRICLQIYMLFRPNLEHFTPATPLYSPLSESDKGERGGLLANKGSTKPWKFLWLHNTTQLVVLGAQVLIGLALVGFIIAQVIARAI